jgi:microcystin-dependent protein
MRLCLANASTKRAITGKVMKFSRDALTAQGAELQSQTVYLSGFSYAVILSAAETASHRYQWSEMTDAEWDDIEADVSKMNEELFKNIMIGTIVPFMGETIPEYLLLCDGGTYAREDYPDLYAILPASLIIDADQFTVPDMAGLSVVGQSATYPFLSQGGEAEHTLTESEMPSHSHTYTPPVPNIDLEDVGAPDLAAAGIGLTTITGSSGGDQPHNNMQPYISLYYCVVAL